MKAKGSNFHPARISGIQKFIREREANKELAEKKKQTKLKPLDLSKGNWSIND